jgi:phosphate transport system substrate-binding protein
MKKLRILLAIALIATILVSCEKEIFDAPFVIEGITIDNYPKVDGSTSTDPLHRLIACKLLGFNYEWMQEIAMNEIWFLRTDIPESFFKEHLMLSQTHNAFLNLIDEKADLILSARKMSSDEKAYASNTGVNLIETPIALDAFIFIANNDNPLKSLTTKQIQDIYTGKITNWKDVGGNNNKINPYIRNPNSGSQELMETLVMQGLEIGDWTVDYESEWMVPSMFQVFSTLRYDSNGLGYTVYYYKEQIVRDKIVKSISVNGVYPDKTTIKNRKYPYVAEVYAVIRSDLDKSSMAYKLYELLLSGAAKSVITESGYIPN